MVKQINIKLNEYEYNQLQKLARSQNLTITELAKKIIISYIKGQFRNDTEDKLNIIIEELREIKAMLKGVQVREVVKEIAQEVKEEKGLEWVINNPWVQVLARRK